MGWMGPVIDIMMSASAETVHYECSLSFETSGPQVSYLRIDADLKSLPRDISGDMDNTSDENLRTLCELGAEAAELRNRELDLFLDRLVPGVGTVQNFLAKG